MKTMSGSFLPRGSKSVVAFEDHQGVKMMEINFRLETLEKCEKRNTGYCVFRFPHFLTTENCKGFPIAYFTIIFYTIDTSTIFR